MAAHCEPLLARPLNSQLAQLFLQALALEAYFRRSLRNIPAVLFELALQIGNLKFALGFVKIRFAEEGVAFPRRVVLLLWWRELPQANPPRRFPGLC